MSNDQLLRAEIQPATASRSVDVDGLVPRFDVIATVFPSDVDPTIREEIEVRTRNTRFVIPVTCRFAQSFRLSINRVDVGGKPGQAIKKDVFYEALAPGWENPRVVSRPQNVDVDVRRIDSKTTRLRLTMRVDAGREGEQSPHKESRTGGGTWSGHSYSDQHLVDEGVSPVTGSVSRAPRSRQAMTLIETPWS